MTPVVDSQWLSDTKAPVMNTVTVYLPIQVIKVKHGNSHRNQRDDCDLSTSSIIILRTASSRISQTRILKLGGWGMETSIKLLILYLQYK